MFRRLQYQKKNDVFLKSSSKICYSKTFKKVEVFADNFFRIFMIVQNLLLSLVLLKKNLNNCLIFRASPKVLRFKNRRISNSMSKNYFQKAVVSTENYLFFKSFKIFCGVGSLQSKQELLDTICYYFLVVKCLSSVPD